MTLDMNSFEEKDVIVYTKRKNKMTERESKCDCVTKSVYGKSIRKSFHREETSLGIF